MGKRKKSLKKAQENIPGTQPFTPPPVRTVDPALRPVNPEHTTTNWGPDTNIAPGPPPPDRSNVIHHPDRNPIPTITSPPVNPIQPPPSTPDTVQPMLTRGGQRVPGMYKHGGMHDGMDSIKPVRGISHKSFKKK